MGKIKDGIYFDSNDRPAHRGIVEVGGKIYYAGKNGVLVKDARKNIHHGMANGLVKHGSYYFDEFGVIDLSSFKVRKRNAKVTNKKIIPLAALLSVLTIVLIVCFGISSSKSFTRTEPIDNNDSNRKANRELLVSLPKYQDEVYLCSDIMVSYYNGKLTLQEVVERSNTAYKPYVFEYRIENARAAGFQLIDDQEQNTVFLSELDLKGTRLTVDNLKADCKYSYVLSILDLNGQEHIYKGSFKTADTNRFIYLQGIYNTRDIGGYDTAYGNKVRQGLLIRGTELDGLVEHTYYLTDLESAKRLNFKCDFDLREESIFNTDYVSRLGENVKHQFFNSPMYGGIFSAVSEELLREIFTALADESNYPMYLHCTYGADRTGTIVFLLQGLLGVSEEDMITEYSMTGFFFKDYVYGENIKPIISGLQGVRGITINEKIENYLRDSVGVTSEQIEKIRSIFIQNYQS